MQRNNPPPQQAPRDRWIDLKALELLCCVKKSTIYALLRDEQSQFPQPVRLSARMVRWSESSVLQWMEDRMAAGNGGASRSTGVQS